jgi:hypothetical protein
MTLVIAKGEITLPTCRVAVFSVSSYVSTTTSLLLSRFINGGMVYNPINYLMRSLSLNLSFGIKPTKLNITTILLALLAE